jgi:very-short-patch-repair endonuclease
MSSISSGSVLWNLPVWAGFCGQNEAGFPFPGDAAPRADMKALLALMATQHGVASTSQARAVGVTRRVQLRLQAQGIVCSPLPGVLALAGTPSTFHGRAMAAILTPGVTAVSHGAAARLHHLDGFERYEDVDVLCDRPAHPYAKIGITVHYTRGPLIAHMVAVDGIRVMSIASTLAVLAPEVGIGPTARALDSALRMGVSADELRAVAEAWRQRGRSGPPALLMLLGERVDKRLPRSWFQRIAGRILATAGIRLVDEYPVRTRDGILLAELDLADPLRKVGVECQSWEWHATPTAQHRDARRKGMLRQLGWEIVDVWWSDLQQPERVIGELTYLLRSRTPNCPPDPARTGRFHRTER